MFAVTPTSVANKNSRAGTVAVRLKKKQHRYTTNGKKEKQKMHFSHSKNSVDYSNSAFQIAVLSASSKECI